MKTVGAVGESAKSVAMLSLFCFLKVESWWAARWKSSLCCPRSLPPRKSQKVLQRFHFWDSFHHFHQFCECSGSQQVSACDATVAPVSAFSRKDVKVPLWRKKTGTQGTFNHFSLMNVTTNGRLYAVIQVKEDGKTKPVWRNLGLTEGTGKSKVQRTFREVVNKFEEEYAAELERRSHPENDIPVYDYLVEYLKKAEPNLQKSTHAGYQNLVEGKIKKYFQAHPHLTVGNLKPKDIEAFYQTFYDDGTTAATVIHYHALLRKAFQTAFKADLINANPFDRIERPKKSKFQGDHYSEEELYTLLELAKTDTVYPVIMLAGGLGMRRSEALGVRWSRIDWEKKTVLLDTKVVMYDQNGKSIVESVEQMKNKTSRRTLPIPGPVLEMLKEEKEKQEMYRRLFKKSYNREYEDYVCVDKLGNILKPDYVTRRFPQLLKENNLRKIRFHDLRHTFASILIGKDVPLINVSDFLGHSTISTTANIYAHLDKASKQASADVMASVLSGGK